MPDVKTLAIFLPFLGAGLIGLTYTINEKTFSSVGLSTYILTYCIIGATAMLLLHFFTPFKIDFSPLKERATASLVLVAISASLLAWMCTVFTIKNISANYTAIAEISYPLFTILFGYLIYSRKIDWSMALGAALIFTGSLVLVVGKLNGR
jgi:drug/metabolite transporter (DMT)-like permease